MPAKGFAGVPAPTGASARSVLLVSVDGLGAAMLGPDTTPRIMAMADAAHRPTGLAQAPDGSLDVSDDVKGRIWKISYVTARTGRGD